MDRESLIRRLVDRKLKAGKVRAFCIMCLGICRGAAPPQGGAGRPGPAAARPQK